MHHRSALLPLALCTSLVQAQYWTPKAPFPSDAEASYSFTIGERMFVGGGLSSTSPATEYTPLNEYLPATNTWEPRAPLPVARYGVSGFSINGKGYVACGWHIGSPALADLWQYDPIADSWTQKASFPGAARYSSISVATNAKGYLGLGYSPYANDWWEYDPLNDNWTQKASFPMIGRQAANAFVIDDQVYVGLGARDVTALSATLYNDWYRYDPLTDTWSPIATFPAAPRIAGYSFSFNGIGYVFCGAGLNGTTKLIYNDGWAYDPINDQWLMLGLFPGIPMDGGFTITSSSSAYIGTGCVDLSGPDWVPLALTDAFWEYKPGGIAGIGEQVIGDGLLAYQQGQELVITLPGSGQEGTIELHDALGRIICAPVKVAQHTDQIRMSLGGLADGLYIVQWRTDGRSVSERIVVE